MDQHCGQGYEDGFRPSFAAWQNRGAHRIRTFRRPQVQGIRHRRQGHQVLLRTCRSTCRSTCRKRAKHRIYDDLGQLRWRWRQFPGVYAVEGLRRRSRFQGVRGQQQEPHGLQGQRRLFERPGSRHAKWLRAYRHSSGRQSCDRHQGGRPGQDRRREILRP